MSTVRTDRAAATRDRVLDAALAVFEERTYGGAAVPVIAARAGVAVGSVYRSFPDKESLASAVFVRAKRRMLAAVVAGVDPAAPVRERVLAMWRGLADYAVADPAGFAFLEHQQHAAYLGTEAVAVATEVAATAAAVVRQGQLEGSVRQGDPDELVALVFGAFVGLVKALRAAGRPLRLDELQRHGPAVWRLLAVD